MWSDNETLRDLVNFSHVADIAAERIVGAKGEPLSIGISGDWGVGKSSMMKLLKTSLEAREDVEIRFVEFNAWLYQSYDDARAALMETITAAVVEKAIEKKDSLGEQARKRAAGLLSRVKKLRVLGLAGSALFDYFTMGHVTPFVAGGMAAVTGLFDGEVSGDDLKKVKELTTETVKGGKELLDDKKPDAKKADEDESQEGDSPRKAIQAFRDDLEATLADLKITLVVLIDDRGSEAERRATPMTDEQQIGAVIDEMYAMISGPAGPRDWGRQANCFLPEARQVRTWVGEAGRPQKLSMTLDDYAANTTPFFAANPFYEVETERRIDVFGNIAHAWSHYEARTSPDDADVERRGVNSIQLFHHPDLGWRIIHMIWDNER